MKLIAPDQLDAGSPGAEPPDRIGRANQAYRDNLDALARDRDALTPTKGHAALGGALTGATLGTLPLVTAAVTHPISALPGGDRSAYLKERDAVQADLDASKAAHPYTFGAADLAGGILPALATGGTTAAGRIAAGAVQGGIRAGGESLSHGEGFDAAREKAGLGAAFGGALTGVGELVGAGISKAVARKGAEALSVEDKAVNDTLQDFIGPSAPRKIRKPLGEMFNADVEKQPVAAPTYKPRDLLLHEDFAPLRKDIMDAARKGDRDAVDSKLQAFNDLLNAKKQPMANAVDSIKKATAGDVVNDIDTSIVKLKGEHGTEKTVEALDELKSNLQKTWASADAGKVQADLGRFAASKATPAQAAAVQDALSNLPQTGRVTLGDVVKAAGDSVKDPKIRTAIEDIQMNFHPDLERPYTDLRGAVTAAQNSVHDTLGTIAETEHAKLKQAVTGQLNQSLENHLNTVAATSPQAEAVVRNLRNSDVLQSSTLALKRANEQAAEQAATNSLGLKARTSDLPSKLLSGEELLRAGESAMHGNIPGAAAHVGGAIAAKVIPGAAGAVRKAGTQAIAEQTYNNTGIGRVLREAAAGNARAQALARRLGLPGWTSDVRTALRRSAQTRGAAAGANIGQPVVFGDQSVGDAVSSTLGGG